MQAALLIALTNALCQSGRWAKLSSIEGSSSNFSTPNFSNDCSDWYGFTWSCRYVRLSLTTTANKGLITNIFAQGPDSGGDDLVVAIVLDGTLCSSNRMTAGVGITSLISTGCVQWITPGTHTIDLLVTGSTGAAIKAGSYFKGGVVSF